MGTIRVRSRRPIAAVVAGVVQVLIGRSDEPAADENGPRNGALGACVFSPSVSSQRPA